MLNKWKLRKFYPLCFSLFFISFLAITVNVIKQAGFHITYSATASMPRGFYLIVPTNKIERYNIVEFLPPADILNFVKKLHWIPDSGLIIKYVFGIPGDDVCIHNESIWINGKKTGKVYRFYSFEKLLPQVKFCGKLASDQYLLLSIRKSALLMEDIFGAVSSHNILGRAIPIFIIDS